MIGGNTAEARPAQAEPGADDLLLEEGAPAAAEPWLEHIEVPEAPRRGPGWLVPAIAILAGLAWFATMIALSLPDLRAGLRPLALVEFIGALCVPPTLIGILYLVALRTSTAEAQRWGRTARAMRAEAASLERVIATLSRKVEENRGALAEQTTMLLAMGDGAVERLQAVSSRVGQEAKAIDASSRTLGEAVTGAEKGIQVVLSSLPRAHDELREMSATLDAAGLSASERAAALAAQLAALAQRGREADEVTGAAAQKLAAHIARMEATSDAAGARLETVTGEMSAAVDGVLDRAADAVDEARKGIAAQGEAMLAMLSANQAALNMAGRDSADALAARIAAIEESVGRVAERLGAEQSRSDSLVAGLDHGIARVGRSLDTLHATGAAKSQELAASLSALTGSVQAMTEAMKTGEDTARTTIRTAEDLLTALDASAREIDETLPEALERLDRRIGASRRVVSEAKPELLALVTAAESTHDAIEAIAQVVAQQRDTLARTSAALTETLDAGRAKADALEAIVDETIATTRRFAEDAAPALVEALLRVRETAVSAAEQARATLATIVPGAEVQLEEAASNALRRAMDASIRRQLGELAETTEGAVKAATRASERLTTQMLTIAETTAQLEDRIDRARAEQEHAERDSFARRISLLIEALNSAAIDITKIYSSEVSDSAWAAYLKGDRGVFTRRAVRLLDTAEARDIAKLYEDDEAFREQVNRYIHDFEAMLRQILALRDGSPLGVTLLSSDMGKLYVAMAQAIERLRA